MVPLPLAFKFSATIALPNRHHPLSVQHLPLTCESGKPVQSVSSMALIEVEKKFRAHAETRRNLLEAFPENVSVSSFEDVYFSEELALTNIWLRRRNTQWELKVPVDTCGPQAGQAAVFREFAGAQVWEELTKAKDFSHAMKPYARITTLRTMITLPWDQHKVNLTFDVCSSANGFEYAVGEVEILVKTPSEVDGAVSSLQKLLTHFELEKLEEKDGKLLTYLRHQNSDLYHRVLQVIRA